MKQVLKYFCFALCFVLFHSCKDSAPPENTPPIPSWEKMKLPDEVLVTSMKIFNDELYVTGRSGGAGPIGGLYKTSDGIKWEIVSSAIKDSVPYGLESVAMRNNKLVILRGRAENKPIYEINADGSII
ncbi:MAG TPA: hypothetical protein VHO28_13395, partial [Ignavibacteriales bacterium]|nr:hypothetical protein [Ignavibacteriales bacterium]